MNGNSSDPQARNCVRCRQPLPRDVTYCVGCGCQNEADAVYNKQIGFDGQIENRLNWTRIKTAFWAMFLR
ncbi:hypothetical protein NA78x_001154 [Anatilimnocola sp. NA78]|uniref:hypothetical protein n=1 Tax=Anatilimnocola sp. NA78 TaxID=3415683 RepID=UPI003CE4FB4E